MICSLITASAKAFVLVLVGACFFGFLPESVTFTEHYITPPRPLEGKLALNTLLNNAERLFEHEIKGPEGFAVLNDELYISLHGGHVVKIKNDEIIPVVKFGQQCENWWEEDKCGRPLGLATADDHHIIVADAYYGIWKYNVKSGEKTVLVNRGTVIEGIVPKIFNDVTVGKDGTIYWTHSSSDFHLYNGLYAMLADPSGRLIKYDPVTKKNTVLLDEIYFANGVALSPEEDFVLVSETGSSRIRRVYLKGPLKGANDIFADGLPGLPDGLRPNGKGGFFSSLIVPRDENNDVMIDHIAPHPLIRMYLARLLAFADSSLSKIHNIYPNYYTKRLIHIIGHFEMLSFLNPKRVTVVELDKNSNIIDSYYGTDGSVRSISDVIPFKGHLYLGSPYNNFLGRIKLSELKNKIVDTGERLK